MPAYRWLRDHAPVFHVGTEDIWILSRYDDVAGRGARLALVLPAESVGYSRVKDPQPVLTAMDPPAHTELRSHTAALFGPRAVAPWRAGMTALLDELLDAALAAGGAINFAEDVANPYLSRFTGGLMGIPDDDLDAIKDGATATSLAMAGDTSAPVAERKAQFRAYFDRFIETRSAEYDETGHCPGPFTLRLLQPGPSGRRLDPAERVPYETLLATGGNETTAQLLSSLTLLISEQPWILDDAAGAAGSAPRRRSRRRCATSRPSPGCSATRRRPWCDTASRSPRTPRCCSCTAPPTTTTATTSGRTSSSSTASRAASRTPTTSPSRPACTSASGPTWPAP